MKTERGLTKTEGLRTRKVSSKALIACIIALLSMLSIPAARAETSMAVSGNMVWDLTTIHFETKVAGGNIFLTGTTDVSVTGDIAGMAKDAWRENFYRVGSVSLWDRLTVSATVDGKSGTLVMLLVGRAAPPGTDWTGTWTILSGTDDLMNLRGDGTWWTANVGYDYSGQVEFE